MTDVDREIKRLISYIRSCREANIDCTVTIDKSLTHGVLNALEKIRQYREIGTVEYFEKLKLADNGTIWGLIDEYVDYKNIGTVEECREAVEKQKAKKPKKVSNSGIRYTDEYVCPNCEKHFTGTGIADYCYHCGQAIMWDENLEGMEDE